MVGSIILGYLSDKIYRTRSPVAMMAISISITLAYILAFKNPTMSYGLFMFVMFLFGFFVSGLNNILQGSCAADLGKLS